MERYLLDLGFLEFRVGLGTELVCSEVPSGRQIQQQAQPARLPVGWWCSLGGPGIHRADSACRSRSNCGVW